MGQPGMSALEDDSRQAPPAQLIGLAEVAQ